MALAPPADWAFPISGVGNPAAGAGSSEASVVMLRSPPLPKTLKSPLGIGIGDRFGDSSANSLYTACEKNAARPRLNFSEI